MGWTRMIILEVMRSGPVRNYFDGRTKGICYWIRRGAREEGEASQSYGAL